MNKHITPQDHNSRTYIAAIKQHRKLTGLSLKESKAMIDAAIIVQQSQTIPPNTNNADENQLSLADMIREELKSTDINEKLRKGYIKVLKHIESS